MRKIRRAALFATLALTVALAPLASETISASAGASRSNVATEASIVDGRINTGDFMVSGGVYGEEDKIVFDKTCAESSKIIGKTKINNFGAYGLKELLNGEATVTLNRLAEGGVFSICFGLQSLSSKRDGTGVVEMRFYEDNGVNFVVYEHCSEDVSNVLLTSKQYTAMQNGCTMAFDFDVTSEGVFTLSVNGKTYVDSKTLYEGGAGYFAIFSEGLNEVTVGDLSLFGYSYDVPENVDYTETFDGNAYNANMFYTMSKVSPLTPSYLTVEDNALKFSNTAGAHITTRYTYSNFELQFDVTDLQRTAVYDENGNIVKLISNWFSIAFGVDDPEQLPESTYTLATTLQFEGMASDEKTDQTKPYESPRFILRDKGSVQKIDSMAYNIWNPWLFDDTVVNVKFSVNDGLIELYIKTEEDEEWGDAQFSYDLGYTPSGYVRIFTWGQNSVVGNGLKYNSIANFTLDNLSLKNTDNEAVKKVLTGIEYKSNYIPTTEDFNYTTKTDDSDLLQNRLNSLNQTSVFGCEAVVSGSMLLPTFCALAVAMVFKGGKKDD